MFQKPVKVVFSNYVNWTKFKIEILYQQFYAM